MKILLVDDSRTIAMVTGARLESFGYQVKHAVDGEKAIEYFRQEVFDLILMDIEMPGMNGFETTTRIRALEGSEPWAWTPIIFVTATDTPTNLITAIEAGGDDFISKTVPESVLQAKMKAMTRIATLRTRLFHANRRLQEQANRDGLTGLLNRRAMDQRLDNTWADAVAQGQAYGLLMIDIDNFKRYNDHYGHQAGDTCLKQVASCLEQVVESYVVEGSAPHAFVARYGGEEFSVVVPNAASDVLERMAIRLVDAVHAQGIRHEKNADHGVVTISVGGAFAASAANEVKALFRTADARLYLAKNAGRNRAVLAG